MTNDDRFTCKEAAELFIAYVQKVMLPQMQGT
jgi:hypothetical protein